MTRQVLLIEDDKVLRIALAQTLALDGMDVIQAASYVECKSLITSDFAGVILSDIRMPGRDGFDVLAASQQIDPDLPVILLTGEGDVPTAVRAMSAGAYDFLEKPCAPDHLIEVLNRAIAHRTLVLKSRLMERQLRHSDPAAMNFPGPSEVTEDLRAALRRAAELPVHLHLYGRAGAGRRLAAHTIHALSNDRQVFLTHSLERARPDTLELPEIPDVPCTLSVKFLGAASRTHEAALLRLIEDHPKLRIITSDPQPLAALRAAGLSKDLYFALNLLEIKMPSLAERKADLPVLFETLVRQASRSLNRDMPMIPESVYAHVTTRDWPDNLPELRNFARSFVLGLTSEQTAASELGLAEQIDAFERMVLSETLRRLDGKAADAAKALGLPRKTFYDKLARHHLRPRDFRDSQSEG